MKKPKSRMLLTLIACSLIFTSGIPRPAEGNSALGVETMSEAVEFVEAPEAYGSTSPQDIPPPIQQFINQAFQAVNNTVIQYASQVNQWKNSALAAAQKTADDFTGCPSTAAQNLYNDLIDKRTKLNAVIGQATAAEAQAVAARTNCYNLVGNNTVFRAGCTAGYNSLPFAGIKASAQAALAAVNSAIAVLKSLKCVSGCNQTAKLVFPTISVRAGEPQSGPSVTVCTQWTPGQFSYNIDPGNGDLSASVYAKLPKCTATKTFSAVGCDWDINLLLPVLKRLNLIPPTVQVTDLTINVPNQSVQVVTGFNQSCSQPLEVCTQVNASADISFGLGTDPITSIKNAMQSVSQQCARKTTVGCLNPPFGIAPVVSTIQIPNPTRASISWRARITPGRVTVDLTRGDFSVACKPKRLSIPGLPKITTGKQVLNFPFLCVQPRFKNLVANQ